MIDLAREFRMLRLLASTLIILGLGFIVGGLGINIFTRSPARPARPPAVSVEPVAEPAPVELTPESDSPSPVSQKPRRSYDESFSSFTRQIGIPMFFLGVLIAGVGFGLRWLIRNALEDDTPEQSPELFRAYAEQLVTAEKQKANKPKKQP
jgi:hypothetical protein